MNGYYLCARCAEKWGTYQSKCPSCESVAFAWVPTQALTPSDAVPPEEPALVTLEVPPDPVTAEDWREKYIAAHAKWSDALRTIEQERDGARRDVAQLTAMVRALSKGDAGTAASVLLTRGPEGSLFVVVAPTLDEQTVADLLGRQIADANTAREQGAAEMRERCAARCEEEADGWHELIDAPNDEPLNADDARYLTARCALQDAAKAIRTLGTAP